MKRNSINSLLLTVLFGFIISTNAVSQSRTENTIYSVVEKMPKYTGGDSELLKYLKENIKYPERAIEEKLEGIVFVSFVIDPKGKIKNPRIVGSVHPLLDSEALRLIEKMPKWKAGEQNGNAVSVQYNLPIRFKLKDLK